MWKPIPTIVLAAGATATLVAVQLAVYTPVRASTPTSVRATTWSETDDCEDLYDSSTSGTSGGSPLMTNTPATPPSSGGSPGGSPLTSPPAHISDVRAPTNVTAVVAALRVTLSEADRQRAKTLRQRVVPENVFRAADAVTQEAVETFIAAGPGGVTKDDPCVKIGAGQRAAIIEAFYLTQRRLPISTADYQFTCALVTDPANAIDVTTTFGSAYRNLDQETYALKNFVNFFGRLPSKEKDGTSLAKELADRDWWAVKYLTYHPVLAATVRSRDAERACIRSFTDVTVDLYEQGEDGDFAKVRKLKGSPPQSLWQWDFIRACTYSGAPFLETFRTRSRR